MKTKKGLGHSKLKEKLGTEGYKNYKGIKRLLYKPVIGKSKSKASDFKDAAKTARRK